MKWIHPEMKKPFWLVIGGNLSPPGKNLIKRNAIDKNRDSINGLELQSGLFQLGFDARVIANTT
jgi:hypothetical protein